MVRRVPGFILDENNGRVCNTPDFPAELYPDGVYCYFVTAIGNTPYFPYIVGQKFQDQPLDQDIIEKVLHSRELYRS